LRYFSLRVVIGIVLVALSALVYLLHYVLFRDAHHIFIYLVGDIAFVFIPWFPDIWGRVTARRNPAIKILRCSL